MDGPGFQEGHPTQAKHMVQFLGEGTVVISLVTVSIEFLASVVLYGVGFVRHNTHSLPPPFSKIGSPVSAACIY